MLSPPSSTGPSSPKALPSPYAGGGGGPNTPICSSKRARKDLKSPTATKAAVSIGSPTSISAATSLVVDAVATTDDLKHKSLGGGGGGGKVALFSPVPRFDGDVDGGEAQNGSGKVPSAEEKSDRVAAVAASIVATAAAAAISVASNEEEEEEVFNPYQFIAGLPPYESVARGKVWLPPIQSDSIGRPTLALDLDETLVHCTVEPIDNPDLVFPVTFNDALYNVYVRKRPYLDYFLETVSKSFEVVVFTASQKVYADVLLDRLDPKRYICHRLFREACLPVQGNLLKDLHVLGRDLNKTVLVDNSPHAYGFNIDNGVPIESWFDDDADTELLKLIGFLRRILAAEDVRPIVHDHFQTYRLIENAQKGFPPVLSAPPF